MIGAAVQPRSPRDHLDAVQVGQPEVEHDHVRLVARPPRATRGAVAAVSHGVAAGLQVDGSARRICGSSSTTRTRVTPSPRPAAIGSEMTIVRPPPGVSSAVMAPPIASTKPFATLQPGPMPGVA